MIVSLSLFAMDFFSVTVNFMLKMNLIRLVISFTNPFPITSFGLMKQDATKEKRIVSKDLMRECNCAIRKAIPTPIAMALDNADNFSGVAPISDDSSVDSLLFSHASESEGGIWGNNNYDDDVSNAHKGANLVPPNFNGNEGVQSAPNIIPAPEGAPCRNLGKAKEFPPAMWCHSADDKTGACIIECHLPRIQKAQL